MIKANNGGKLELRKGFSYPRELPVNFSESDRDRFDSIRVCEVSPAFVEKLEHVQVCQYYIFKGVNLLEDFCLPIQKRGTTKVWKNWLKLKFFPYRFLNESIWVTDSWSKNYFHWILECLPRLLALKELGINAPLLIPEHLYKAPYIQESLSDLGVEVVPFTLRETMRVTSLHVVSHDIPCAFDPEYLRKVIGVFNRLDNASKRAPFRRIYISRRQASKRRIKNEEDLISVISSFDFEVVQMEKLTFKEQRELMRDTNVLLSIHGAGLANMIFMPQESKVIELHPDVSRYNSCFYHLATALNRDYYYSFESANHPNPQEADIDVDLARLQMLLSSL